jgi:hypothetical protein
MSSSDAEVQLEQPVSMGVLLNSFSMQPELKSSVYLISLCPCIRLT